MSEKPLDIDVGTMERFMRIQPSSITLGEFITWPEDVQERAAEMYEAVVAERIYAMAMAIVDEGSRGALIALKDGGVAQERTAVERALDRAEAAYRGGRVQQAAQPAGARPLGRKG